MIVTDKISNVRNIIKEQKLSGKKIGLVPTMGYLHEGHLSLVRIAKKHSDFVAVSIFVNPIQFGPNEDFDRYPRDLERDLKLLEKEGCDLVFAPSVEEMYPSELLTTVNVDKITEKLCGAFRPGHFKGVTTVVAKLFNIFTPDIAVFGQKDAQQVAVIKKMVEDLNFPVEIIKAPIVRESDGLAMSSRNVYLNPEERKAALILSKSLKEAEKLLLNGERNANTIIKKVNEVLNSEPLCKVQYVSCVHPDTLEDLTYIKDKALIAIACFIGTTRLIDNLLWGENI
ncbi:pantoate--beta-alanine ligase [Thermoanaerobacter sp. CM-CNRG TB177]|jgi:pantoate--beta-alanine ligase|uniref:Pantothenate synthetase n=2 Tax=Thermoanaerobacter TaxID=1754 RepID=PANC_THEP3|nr:MULTISPECIES: pantoate--beta-alanine ligase [Thermoanaerobacter]B0KC91.1 RecName: Full=Pantothenate synthetase; Short=PS; AltName: Full=Pantoate--beta-alanine ligase; AltName: Full=Pantoate-activating enzyme [Thermoanaerobacter pseudethanolicus ATCC 33223]ABY95445.1 pantoate--beta-alanine ligase [Thermoanaerobacter pseudethanolicus ATCC 33223]ADV80389.1 pantoate/beta-alanine ligase [Thermoanaerobacter brockii subsp. finnii Ako-1]MBT1278756.1 pantoate--beta-alanine ligase [Thermoanaerobacter 